jgi:hypothetical protein
VFSFPEETYPTVLILEFDPNFYVTHACECCTRAYPDQSQSGYLGQSSNTPNKSYGMIASTPHFGHLPTNCPLYRRTNILSAIVILPSMVLVGASSYHPLPYRNNNLHPGRSYILRVASKYAANSALLNIYRRLHRPCVVA